MEFCAEVKDGCSLGLLIQIPFDVYARYGTRRLKVWVEIRGLRFSAVFQRIGRPEYVMVFKKEVIEALNLQPGERVAVKAWVRTVR